MSDSYAQEETEEGTALTITERSFTDLLFPKTRNSEEQTRKNAKARLSYWITVGEPLARIAQRFGYEILLRLPAQLTNKE